MDSENSDPPPTNELEDTSQMHSEDELEPSEGEDDSEDLEGQKLDDRSQTSSETKMQKAKDKKNIAKQTEFRLSDRMEYLSRPKKDFLDVKVQGIRLDGSIPEQAYPSWKIMPLPTKIPFDNCPIPVTSTKLGENLFLPPPGDDFDREDENNLLLPFLSYDSLHDPYLKNFLRSNQFLDHLKDENFITDSERTICSLEDINKYRTYQRRILAADVQKVLRDLDEEYRRERAEGMDKKIKREMRKYREQRTQGTMRRWIKDTVASIKDSSMTNQRTRDARVLNCQMRRQEAQRARVRATEDRYKRIYNEHVRKKYDDEEKIRKKAHLAYAKKDLEVLEKLCKRQKEEKLKSKEKLDDFWKRKSDWQEKWLERGEELERKRLDEKVKNMDILRKNGRLPVLFLRNNSSDSLCNCGSGIKHAPSDVRPHPNGIAEEEDEESLEEFFSNSDESLEPEAGTEATLRTEPPEETDEELSLENADEDPSLENADENPGSETAQSAGKTAWSRLLRR